MKIPLMILVCLAALAVPSSAMKPDTEAFLISIGIDDKSDPSLQQAETADKDGTIKTTYRGDDVEHSLESLARAKRSNGVKAFITTRVFIRNLKANYAGTSIPKKNYDALYLTKEERILVGRKIAEGVR
jgi:hypothetical protein